MKIGILGTGDVGRSLGKGFIERGDEVKMGSRDPKSDKIMAWVNANGKNASSGTNEDAVKFGDIVVIATKWDGTENALKLAGIQNFAGKVVIDVTNPLAANPNGPPGLALGFNDSAGEQIQRWLPQSHVVKAFNIVNNQDMVKPSFPDGPPDMFICGNDDGAKKTVLNICHDFGWPNTLDIGGIEGARLLEPLCILWVVYGVRTGGWRHAFKMIKK